MNVRLLLKRKFRHGWSDLQFLVMLEMGQNGRMAFMDLFGESDRRFHVSLTNRRAFAFTFFCDPCSDP